MNDILIEHGRAMRLAALEHAVALIEIDPVEGLKILKEKIESEKS